MASATKISIITPSLNQGRYIAETIASVASQDYPSLEHIVVDGVSTDETLDVLRTHEQLPHFRWTSEPDRGQTDAINKGIRRTDGEIVAYLNSDDVYRPGAFQRVAEAFAKNPACGVIVGCCDEIDADSKVTGTYPALMEKTEDLLRFWLWGTKICIAQPAVFLRRGVLEEAGLFDESYDFAMDYEMWLRLASRTRFQFIPQTLAGFRVTEETKSQSRPYELWMESYRAARKHRNLAPPSRRWKLAIETRRETAGHLLTLAEEVRVGRAEDRRPRNAEEGGDAGEPRTVSLEGRELRRLPVPEGGPSPREMAFQAAALWPLICSSPRWWRAVRNK